MYEFVLDYSIMMNNIEIFQFTFRHLQAELILLGTIYISTVKSESIHSVGFGFSSISPSNLGQISKSGTVLKS